MIDPTVGAVVLAAGKGTRLNSTDVPKVMREIGGRPMASYTVETLERMGFKATQICLVVGFQKEKIVENFGSRVSYAEQTEQKGTAHAAHVGMSALPPSIKNVLVMGGDDSAFYRAETLEKFIKQHSENHATVSLLTAEPKVTPNLGRVVRKNGSIKIVERESLTEEQKKIKEISTGTFVFNRAWFEKVFPSLKPMRKLGEYGLPSVFASAIEEKIAVSVIKLNDSEEWFGVNTPAELEAADRRKTTELKI